MPGFVITKSAGPKPDYKPGDHWPTYCDWWGTLTAHCADCECPALLKGWEPRASEIRGCDCRCHEVSRRFGRRQATGDPT